MSSELCILTMKSLSYTEPSQTINENYLSHSRSSPNCARCRNHDILQTLKGHKRYCKFMDCTCHKCQLTVERQKVMAYSTAIRRAEEQDRERVKKGLPTSKRMLSLQCGFIEEQKITNVTADSSINKESSTITAQNHSSCKSFEKSKSLWDSIILLLDLCKLPLNTSPLLYIILNKISSDPKEVYKCFKEAEEELKLNCTLGEFHREAGLLDHLSPWAFYYSINNQNLGHYYPNASDLGLVSFSYNPYHALPSYNHDIIQGGNIMGYSVPSDKIPPPAMDQSSGYNFKCDQF